MPVTHQTVWRSVYRKPHRPIAVDTVVDTVADTADRNKRYYFVAYPYMNHP